MTKFIKGIEASKELGTDYIIIKIIIVTVNLVSLPAALKSQKAHFGLSAFCSIVA